MLSWLTALTERALFGWCIAKALASDRNPAGAECASLRRCRQPIPSSARCLFTQGRQS